MTAYLYDCHDAYRAYAAMLNWRRPRGRKLSWRHLNWRQRAQALTWADRLLPVGGIAGMAGRVTR
jgi:hypothetical protein